MAPHLDYLRASPVRGQLEPWDPRTAKGWRYIQTTDTLNQLKVLLPPGTAAMYEQLLKFEVFELRKKTAVSWDRILQIRHLKDRMIRKCQRLSKSSPNDKHLDSLAFQTVVAPADFRVKEMEKWFREQQKRTNALLPQPHPSNPDTLSPSRCPHCISAQTHAGPSFSALVPRRPTHSIPPKAIEGKPPTPQRTHPTGKPDPSRPLHEKSSLHLVQHNVQRAAAPLNRRSVSSPPPPPERSQHQVEAIASPPSQRSVSSPPPLPHLLRIRDLETGYDLSIDPQVIVSAPLKNPDDGPRSPSIESEPESEQAPPTPLEPLQEQTPQLARRRSCIKRTSTSDLAKSVSWADDRGLTDQLAKYTTAARQAQVSGRKWEEIREVFIEQMQGLETLQAQVEQCIEHLRSESESLHRADETIRRQKDVLRSTFEEFEKKQRRFQTRGESSGLYIPNDLDL